MMQSNQAAATAVQPTKSRPRLSGGCCGDKAEAHTHVLEEGLPDARQLQHVGVKGQAHKHDLPGATAASAYYGASTLMDVLAVQRSIAELERVHCSARRCSAAA